MKSKSLWIACKSCGKLMSVDAKVCPSCGAKHSRFRTLKWIGGGLFATIVIAAIIGSEKPAVKATSTDQTSSAATTIALPTSQSDFISAVDAFAERFRLATNELQQSSLRGDRQAALMKALDSNLGAEGWKGTLQRLETNSEGHAVISVRLSDHVRVITWNNALSDLADSTMIRKGTPLYDKLSQMAVGDAVTISGRFLRSDQDGVRETNLTIRGAMTRPDFLFLFNDISKQQ